MMLALLPALPARATFRAAALPTGGIAAPIFPPVNDAWSRSFDAFAGWMKTPAGRALAVSVDPPLVALVGIHSDARRVAASPLADRLAPDLAPALLAIAQRPAAEQLSLLKAVALVRAEAAPRVEPKVLAAWEAARPSAVTADMGEYRALTEQLKGLAAFGPAARVAYRAAKRAFIERAMMSAERTARELAPIDWDSGDFGSDAPPSEAPGPGLAQLLSVKALAPPSFFNPAHWRPSPVPDRRYARRLDAAADLLGSSENLDSPEKMRAHHARVRLLDTIRAKDGAVYAHLMRVGLMSGLIAWRMGFSMDYAQRVAWGARAHDIGKREDEILAVVNKPGKLTPEERKTMERHTVAGAEIITAEAALDPLSRRVARRAALSHHETLDGKGYPYGLKEGEIPMEARITAVADFFDALIENRPYRAGMTIEKALAIMEPHRDKFDPHVWNAFTALVSPVPAP